MDLLSYFRVLRRRWVLILVCTVAGATLGAATTLLDRGSTTKTYYKATHSLLWDNSGSGQDATASGAQPVINLQQMAIFATTGEVPLQVAKTLGTSDPGRVLAEHVTTTTNDVTNTLEIAAVADSPKGAVTLADTFAAQVQAYIDARYQTQYDQVKASTQAEVDSLRSQADQYQAQVGSLPANSIDGQAAQRQLTATLARYYDVFNRLQFLVLTGARKSGLSTLESAQSIPIGAAEYESRIALGASGNNHLTSGGNGNGGGVTISTSSANTGFKSPLSRGVLGALLGLLAGVGLAFLAERVDRKVRTHFDTEAAFGLPVLAEIPQLAQGDADLVAVTSPLSRASEAYRAVRTAVLFQRASVAAATAGRNGGAPLQGTAGDGFFELDHNDPLVLMVTSPSPREGKTTTSANLAAVFAEAGASVLVVNCDFRRPTIHRLFRVPDQPRRVQDTGIAGVQVVTDVVADPGANPAQVVAAQRQVINAARGRVDVIVLDTAPLLTANDAVELVGVSDLLLIVARAGSTSVESAQRAMELLTRVEAPVGGVVLVGSVPAGDDAYYYYQPARAGARSPASSAPAPPTNGAGVDESLARRPVAAQPDDLTR